MDAEGGEVKILSEILKYARNEITMIYLEYHSEADRLTIDQIMKEKYNLAYAQATGQHRGTNLYILKTFGDEAYYVQHPIATD
jgi:hypothetical protein